ncbi:unnamed protein product [Caenorhabditis brenneri]
MEEEVRAIAFRGLASSSLALYRFSEYSDFEICYGLKAYKVLATLGILVVTTESVRALHKKWQRYRARRRAENKSDEGHMRHRENLKKRIEETLQESVHECPICLGDANFPVMTNCAHLFCCPCIIRYWKQSKSIFDPCQCACCRCTFNKLIPIRWPIPGTSDEIDEQLQKINVDFEDYNKRFSTEKPLLESIPFHVKRFIRANWIDIVRLVVVPACSFIYYRFTADLTDDQCFLPKNPYDVLLFFDQYILTILLLHDDFFQWYRNHLAELRGEE